MAAGVTADDVGGPGDRGRRLVGARVREATDGCRDTRRGDAEDRVQLFRAVSTAEQIRGTSEPYGRRIMQSDRQGALTAGTARPCDQNRARRRVSSREPTEQQRAAIVERGRSRVL